MGFFFWVFTGATSTVFSSWASQMLVLRWHPMLGRGSSCSVPDSDWSLNILFTLGKVLVLSKSEDLIRSSLARLWDCGPELHSEKVQRASRESGLVYPTLTLSAPVSAQTGVLLSPPHGWGASDVCWVLPACLLSAFMIPLSFSLQVFMCLMRVFWKDLFTDSIWNVERGCLLDVLLNMPS